MHVCLATAEISCQPEGTPLIYRKLNYPVHHIP